jgi:alcohol dehydrogenase class IV
MVSSMLKPLHYRLYFDGDIEISSKTIIDFIMNNGELPDDVFVDEITDDIKQFNRYSSKKLNVKTTLKDLSLKWSIPQKYIEMARALGKHDAKNPMEFIEAIRELQRNCGVDDLKMSDYGIKREDFPKFASNARETMGGLFKLDPCSTTEADTIKMFEDSYK